MYFESLKILYEFPMILALACKISALKNARIHACKQYQGPSTNLLSILCILIEILSIAHEKGGMVALMI